MAEANSTGLPEDAKLQLTNGYAPMFGQLSRVLSFLADRDEPKIPRSAIVEGTGLSDRHIENMSSIGTAMGLIVPRALRLTSLGQLVARHDPFFDALGTLWLCHYQIASNPRHVIWNRFCNTVLPEARAPIALVPGQFSDLIGQYTERTLNKHVRKEIRSFLRAYTRHRMRKLDYLMQVDDKCYLADQPAPVPDLVLLATILLYRDVRHQDAAGMEIPTLCHGGNSPGRILHLSEWKVREALERLQRLGHIEIESRANLDQLRFGNTLTADAIIRHYYEERQFWLESTCSAWSRRNAASAIAV